jgi:chromosome segregation ATPase
MNQQTQQTQKIHAAADALLAQGVRPTLAAIREAIGGGSFTTISQAMKNWTGRQSAPVEVNTTPETITRAAIEQATAFWQQAKAQAEDQLKTERQSLDEARLELESETAEAAALADELSSENENLKAIIQQLKSEAVMHQQEFSVLTIRVTAADAALVECRARAEQLQKQLERAEKRADDAAEASMKAREEAAELRGKFALMSSEKKEDKTLV